MPMWVCAMVTMAANALIGTVTKANEDDPRVPSVLEDDAWSTWFGESGVTPEVAKAALRTMEGVNWQAVREQRRPRPGKF